METSSHPPDSPPERTLISKVTVGGDDLFDAWRFCTSPIYDLVPSGDPSQFQIQADFRLLDSLFICLSNASSYTAKRGAEHLSDGESDFLVLQLYITGNELLQMDSGSFKIRPGQVMLRDWAHEFVGVTPGCQILGIAIPRHLIHSHDWLYRSSPCLSWEPNTPTCRLLAGAMLTLWEDIESATRKDAPVLASGLIGLLNGVLNPIIDLKNDSPDTSHRQLAIAKSYITANLGRNDLDAQLICNELGFSRSSLYRLFKETDGVRTYIRQQRLRRCFNDLSLGASGEQKIRDVAQKWGFTNPSHFNRLFRVQYNMTPRELVDGTPLFQDPKSLSHQDSSHKVHQWLGTLS